MNRETFWQKQKQHSLFPPSLFFVYLGVLFLMAGIHTGLIVGATKLGWSDLVKVYVPLFYWTAVAVILTLFTRRMIRKTYEEPMLRLADATRKVAGGDFSVYVPPVHTADKTDYLDQMILDFDKMVEELGSIETLKTDFFSDVSHEFKSPLAVISSNAELLQKSGEYTFSAQQKEQVENIRYATKRLANLIQNMLKLNKLEKQAIRPGEIRMDQMKNFTAYEYKEITMRSDKAPFYLDCYESFGWQQDENFPMQETKNTVLIRLKRDRKLVNRTELTRLQRSFEAGMDEITALEHSKTTAATIWALCIALAGTAFMAGSVFAVTADPPRIVLCILLAVLAFAGWIAPYFVYRIVRDKKTRQVNPFIEEKTEEIYAMCEKGQSLL